MKLNKIASLISRSRWLIDPRVASTYLPAIARFMNGEPVSFFGDEDEDPELQCYILTPEGSKIAIDRKKGATGGMFSDAPEGSVAVIPITGVILKEDNCGAPGTETMGSWLKSAYTTPNIVGAILRINSGGGSVFGTGEFGQVISSANKPVIAFNEGLMASAAYWIGSSAKEIWSSHATTEIRSIGTAINFYDNREALAKWGYKQVYINSDTSPDKNQDYFKAIDGDTEPIKVEILNPTNDIFMQHVRSSRGDKLSTEKVTIDGKEYDEPLTGKVYLAEKARDKFGLIDRIGRFEEAIERVYELAENPDPDNSLKNSNNMFGFKKHKSISSLIGKKAEEVTAADVKAINEELVAENVPGITVVLDTDMESMETMSNENTATLNKINGALGAGNEKKTVAEGVDALIAQRDEARKQAEEYGDQPGEVPSTPKSTKKAEGAEITKDEEENKYKTSFDVAVEELDDNE